jgi:hypothetical protein
MWRNGFRTALVRNSRWAFVNGLEGGEGLEVASVLAFGFLEGPLLDSVAAEPLGVVDIDRVLRESRWYGEKIGARKSYTGNFTE